MKRRIITISRQFGSGGREIGFRLAEELGIKCYDKEMLHRAAQESGISEKLFEHVDEKPVNSLLYSLATGGRALPSGMLLYNDPFSTDRLFLLQSEVIRKIASEESCVFVGRCADFVLQENPNLLSIMIHAPLADRIRRVKERNQISEEEARNLIKKTDKRRASYYNFFANGRWGEADNYDLCVDSSRLGIHRTVALLKEFVQLVPVAVEPR